MQSREEIIKEFLNDEEKVKVISEDEEFINKVSEGKATPGTYKAEFNKFGLVLTDEEATQVANMISKIHSTPDEKLPEVLNDLSLENVSGGNVYEENDNIAIENAIFEEKYGFKKSDIGAIAGWTATGVAGGIVAAGMLTVTVGLICGQFATAFWGSAIKNEKRGNTKKAIKDYELAKKLLWMFPDHKASLDSHLKSFSK